MGVWDLLLYEGFLLVIGVMGIEVLVNIFSFDFLGLV